MLMLPRALAHAGDPDVTSSLRLVRYVLRSQAMSHRDTDSPARDTRPHHPLRESSRRAWWRPSANHARAQLLHAAGAPHVRVSVLIVVTTMRRLLAANSHLSRWCGQNRCA